MEIKIKVSIVVVTYNRKNLLIKTLQSILKQTVYDEAIQSVIIVDNASTDGTDIWLNKIASEDPKIKIYKMSKNLGGSAGFGFGMRKAVESAAEVVGVLDDDVELYSDAVENILKMYSAESICGCLRLDKNGKIAERASREYNLKSPFILNPRQGALNELYKYAEELEECESVAFLSFEGMFIPVDIILKIGYPRDEFFVFGDDCDYCIRARKAGFKIYIIREAKLVRQIDYNEKDKFKTWKAKYIIRNFVLLHFLHGENWSVRLKAILIAIALSFTGKVDGCGVELVREAARISRELRKRYKN